MIAARLPDKPHNKYPFYWFALLEQAVDADDFCQAAHAQRKLERLGMKVIYTPQYAAPQEVARD